MLKRLYLFAALFWTGIILYFCLENAKHIPQINIPCLDKIIHIAFHFGFVLLWFLYIKKKLGSLKNYKIQLFLLVCSFVFGIIIELIQQYYSTSRSADILDILANLSGAILAVLLIKLLSVYTVLLDKI